MVERIYVEKMPAFAQEALAALADIRNVLGFSGVIGLRILNRYDVEGVDHALFSACRFTVFAEPQTDLTYDESPQDADAVFAALKACAPSAQRIGEVVPRGEKSILLRSK